MAAKYVKKGWFIEWLVEEAKRVAREMRGEFTGAAAAFAVGVCGVAVAISLGTAMGRPGRSIDADRVAASRSMVAPCRDDLDLCVGGLVTYVDDETIYRLERCPMVNCGVGVRDVAHFVSNVARDDGQANEVAQIALRYPNGKKENRPWRKLALKYVRTLSAD